MLCVNVALRDVSSSLFRYRYLGAWVGRRQALPKEAGAIVDLTCELPLRSKYRSLPYLNIPT